MNRWFWLRRRKREAIDLAELQRASIERVLRERDMVRDREARRARAA